MDSTNSATTAVASATSTGINPWKLTTIGLLAVLGTSLTTGLATAYFMGPDDPTPAVATAPAAPRVASAPRSVERPARVQYVAQRAAPVSYAPQRAQYTPVAAGMASCDTNAKIGTIAKDGLIGGLLGAGLGAGSGAIVNGGRGAGKGAAIGGIAGAVAGGLYGAYQNGKKCS